MTMSLRRMSLTTLLLCAGCSGEVVAERCPEGTERQLNRCVPPSTLAPATPRDAGPVPDAGPLPDSGPAPDAGMLPDAGQGVVAVPFYVDQYYAMSGFFPGPPGVVDIAEGCSGFTGTHPDAVCRRITFTPNSGTFGGFFFQYPADNWGAEPGLAIAPGATKITFRAWGALGGESMKFGAGINNTEANSDGWAVESAPMVLGTEPTELSVDITGVGYGSVVGAFLWVAETPDGSTPVTFFLDNVRWE